MNWIPSTIYMMKKYCKGSSRLVPFGEANRLWKRWKIMILLMFDKKPPDSRRFLLYWKQNRRSGKYQNLSKRQKKLKGSFFDISSMSTQGFWLTYVKTSFFVYFGDKNAIFCKFLLSPTWHQRERLAHHSRRQAGGRRDPCVGERPHHGLWYFYWKYVRRCSVKASLWWGRWHGETVTEGEKTE